MGLRKVFFSQLKSPIPNPFLLNRTYDRLESSVSRLFYYSNNFPVEIFYRHRLLTSSFYHLDDMHLYYNMASFLWKGHTLEQKYGARKFAIILTVFSALSQVLMLVLNKVRVILLEHAPTVILVSQGPFLNHA